MEDKSYRRDMANCPTFLTLTCDCDLDIGGTDPSFVCNTSPSVEKHLCQVILKFLHGRRS